LGLAGISSAEGFITNEDASGGEFDPGGSLEAVSFSTAAGVGNALTIGDLPKNGGYKSIWIKRTVAAAAEATASDVCTLTVQGETTA
jgi:hypothetical protein